MAVEQEFLAKPSIYAPDIEQKYGFNKGFDYCCRTLVKRVHEDYDATIAITGDEGVSKSTLANWIGFKTDKKYTLEKNCLFSPNPSSVVKAIRNLPRFSAVNADEAAKILYKQEWWLQVFINKFYRLCRQDNKISIMTMPRFTEFNEGFRNHRIILWIHILDRGIGIAYDKDWSPFVKDPWHFDDNQKLIEKAMKGRNFHDFSLEDKLKIFQRSHNFVSIITFPDLPEDIRRSYKEMAALHKYEGVEDEYEEGARIRRVRIAYGKHLKTMVSIMMKDGRTKDDIARSLGISINRLNGLVRLANTTLETDA